ncbi:MAG TPA: tetratricopeptide repeat protein [Candidatus Koribacter sp.]
MSPLAPQAGADSAADTPEALQQLRTCIDANGLRGAAACRSALKIGVTAGNAAEAHTFLASQLHANEAASEYREAIAADPTYALAYLRLAELLNASGAEITGDDKEDAVELLQTAAKLRPDWAAPRRQLAAVLWSRKRFVDAIAAQKDAMAVDPEDATMAATLKDWESQFEDLKGALKQWETAVLAKSHDATARMRYGDALSDVGRSDEARDVFREAYKTDTGIGAALGADLLYRGYPDIACEVLPRAYGSAKDGDVAAHISDLQTCVRKFPNDTEALRVVADLQLRSGDYRAALKTFQEALSRDSEYFEKHPQQRAAYDRVKSLVKPR